MKTIIKKILKLLIPFALILFLLQSILLNLQEVSVYFTNLRLIPLILSFSVLMIIYPESGFSWYVVVKKLGVNVKFRNALYIWIVSNTSRYIPGTIWQYVGRVELGQRMGIARKEGMVAVLYETILITISGLLFSIFVLSSGTIMGIELHMILVVILILLIAVNPTVINKALIMFTRISKKKMPSLIFLTTIDYIQVLPFFVANFLLNGLALMLIVYAFTGSFEIEKLLIFSGMYSLSWLIGYFSIFAPGGIGVTEASLALLLGLLLPLPLSSAIAILYRFLLVIAELLVFIFVLNVRNSKTST